MIGSSRGRRRRRRSTSAQQMIKARKKGPRRGGVTSTSRLRPVPFLHGFDLVLALCLRLGRLAGVCSARHELSDVFPVVAFQLRPIPKHPFGFVSLEEARHRSFAPFVSFQSISSSKALCFLWTTFFFRTSDVIITVIVMEMVGFFSIHFSWLIC